MRRPSRVNSLCPNQFSSSAICRLTAPWVTPSSAAASDFEDLEGVEGWQAAHDVRE
jgi:hypothetical protein